MGPRRSALVFLGAVAVFGWLSLRLPASHDAAHPHHFNVMEADTEDIVEPHTAADCHAPIVFAGHDPSSKNHAKPIYEAVKAQGTHCVRWFDLAEPQQKREIEAHPSDWGARLLDGLGAGTKPALVFTGNSVAPVEYSLIAAAKTRGVQTATLVEFGPVTRPPPNATSLAALRIHTGAPLLRCRGTCAARARRALRCGRTASS